MRQELVIKSAEECGNVFVFDAGIFQNDDDACYCAIREIMEIDGNGILIFVKGKKSFG